MSEGYLEKLQELVAERSTDYGQMGQLVALAKLAPRRMESEIIAMNLNLDMTKKRLAIAVQLLNETNRVATKMKCWEFPVNLKIDIRQFLWKDITPCEGGAK